MRTTATGTGASHVRNLADPLRIAIVELLSEEPMSVSEMAENIGVPADRLYYHLDRLEQGGLIALKSVRPKRIYELGSPLDDSSAPLTQREKGEFATAVFDLARIEAGAAHRREPEDAQLSVTFQSLRLPRKELDAFISQVNELIRSMAERESPRARSTRVIFGAYSLKR